MAFTADDIRANREYLASKLRAEKQRNDVLKAVEAQTFDFCSTREAETRSPTRTFRGPGRVAEVAQLVARLPTGREIVTYCWGHD